MDLPFRIVPVTAYRQNCTVVKCSKTDDIAVIDPGHGPMSSFGQERLSNPFVGDRALRIDQQVR